jgi:hypothetical protein
LKKRVQLERKKKLNQNFILWVEKSYIKLNIVIPLKSYLD